MRDIWFTSDQHYGHDNILTFYDSSAKLIRGSCFYNVKHMNDSLIDNHNSVVKPGDYVYNLGDFAVSAQIAAQIIPQLNGSQRLIVGNHDDIKRISPLFKKVTMLRIFKEQKFICTHVPIRTEQFTRNCVLNVHGHLHQRLVEGDNADKYINVCVERTNYTPIHFDELTAIASKVQAAM